MKGNFGLIDRDTPEDAYTAPSMQDGSPMTLVFSDEFNTDGRTFYPGDDPFWEAVDLHYWGTNNLEWYDPASLTTDGGSLAITLSKVVDPTKNHNMDYRGGMMSTWNKFCFTGGQVCVVDSLCCLPMADYDFGFIIGAGSCQSSWCE
jgi:beta-glucan synthesis-associated protein KRE6